MYHRVAFTPVKFFGLDMFSTAKTFFRSRSRVRQVSRPVCAGVLLAGLGYVLVNNGDISHENDPNFELIQVQLVSRHGIRAPQR